MATADPLAPDALVLKAVTAEALADALDGVLPQTQCRQCGHDGCRPYAEAMARGEAAINQCPPGGADTIAVLAQLTGQPPLPPDEARGVAKPAAVALIDEALCIGCMLCIHACPVDAITGAAKRMHTVIAEECTGCELCLPPCPMDCITIVPVARSGDTAAHHARAMHARERYRARSRRLADEGTRKAGPENKGELGSPVMKNAAPTETPRQDAASRAVTRALARARQRISEAKR